MASGNIVVYGIKNMRMRSEIEYLLNDEWDVIAYSQTNFQQKYTGGGVPVCCTAGYP